MSFLHPGWLLLMLILPFIVLGAILAHRGRNKAWKRMVAPRLRKQLVKEGSYTRRWISLTLAVIGCALLITVIARPYQGETSTTEQIQSRNILIAIDTSRSMLVRDASPDRIGTAKATALELLNTFPNDRIGVIAFSGTPVLMAPLTIDHGSVHETISQLDTEVIPSGGSDLASSVKLAIKTFQKTGQKSNALIIISDGEDHSQQTDLVASDIRDSSIFVCTIGVGSRSGGIIPDLRQRDGKYRDVNGQTVHSQMIPDALDAMARAGRGTFLPASSGADAAIKSALSSLESDQQEGREIHVPNEKFQWFLFPALLLLALSLLIRSQLFSAKIVSPSPAIITGILMLALGHNLHAATDIERGEAAYESKDYKASLIFFRKALPSSHGEDRRAIQFSLGSSAFRLKQWQDATHYFSFALLTKNKRLQEKTHYNYANSLLHSAWSQFKPDSDAAKNSKNKKQQYTVKDLPKVIILIEDSIAHYQSALKIDPTNESAAHNLNEAEKLLEQLKEKQAEQESKDKKDSENKEQGDSKDPKDDGEKSDQPGDGNDPQKNPEKSDQGDPKDDPQNDPNADPGDKQKNDLGKDPKGDQAENQQPMERKEGETEEAFAARFLKDHADAETRPVSRRLLRHRRSAKDW